MLRDRAPSALQALPLAAAIAGLLALAPLHAGADADIRPFVGEEQERAVRIARSLWDWAELGYLEERSSGLLQRELAAAGFSVESGVVGLPTAFVASAGQGKPVVAILAEFDALPGISQTADPERRERPGSTSAQACGHNLFGGASVAAAIAVARWLERSGSGGTVRVYGTPAEEGGSGKVYMVRGGLFRDVDAALHWHPGDRNDASPIATLANKSAKFRFRGVAAHAALAPEQGRSALDAVEAMNFMVNLMREHVPDTARIHYVISDGGKAPNVVPEHAESFYYVRHPEPTELERIWERLDAAARGAALGTGTEVSSEIIHGNRSLLPNETLARAMHANLAAVGAPQWDGPLKRYAETMRSTLTSELPALERAQQVEPFALKLRKASTDVGDVSWVVPTTGLHIATWPPGVSAHSWQSAAASGSPLGERGMLVAAEVLARTAVDLLRDPSLLRAAQAELEESRGSDFRYAPLLGDRAPPLDYRR